MHVTGGHDGLLQSLEIRPLNVDDLSTARYVVSTAFERGSKGVYSAAETTAFTSFVRSPHYGDILLGNHAYGAWIGSEMVGVAAWTVSEEKKPTARILALFVHPLFTGQGIGTHLAEYLAQEARAAGYQALEASVMLNATVFFERLGYIETKLGTWALSSGRELPITFMRKAPQPRSEIRH
ncbi:MAG: GNAT family N-acetyltransferase [Hyphomicrobium sp.]|jgi:GNAT superfamily N-acetyltransferase